MVFYTESLKMVIALGVYMFQLPRLEYTGLEGISLRSSAAYAVPALMYAAQNNINYFALELIDPPTYQVWGSAKLIFAGVFSRALLGRLLTWRQWAGLALLAAGMGITTLKPTPEGEEKKTSQAALGGIGLVLISSALSGLSGIVNEWLIKFQDPKAPLMLKNLMLYAFGAVMCSYGWQPSKPLGDPPLLVCLVLVQAAVGICVSLVLKYSDTLVKGFSVSGGVVVAMVASAALFDFHLVSSFLIGVLVVCAAFYLYFV